MNVALYVRVSTQEQANEGYSIGEQTERLHKYADAMRWRVYNTYTDGGYSGGDTNRPALQKMISDIKAGHIQKVVVYKLDRLSRSQKDTLDLIEDVFLKNGVDFVSMNENFDTSTPFGRAMIGILAVFAQLEREQIKERMGMGKDARVKSGKWCGGGGIPYGYDYFGDNLQVNQFEAMVIKDIFKMAAEGMTPHMIAKTLNERGFKTRRAEWTDKIIFSVLRSKNYIGYTKFKKEWYAGTHEPIIDVETFNRVNELLDKRRELSLEHRINPGKASTYLGGLLVCGQCGAKYSKNTQNTTHGNRHYKYHVFCCNSRVSHGKKSLVHDPNCKNKNWKVDELTGLVMGEIKKLSLDPDYIHQLQGEPDTNNDKIIEDAIKSLDNQLQKLIDLYTVGQIPVDLLQTKIKALDEQKGNLTKELDAIKVKRAEKLTKAQTAKLVKDFPEVLERGNFDEIRGIILELIEKIVLDGDNITIYWRF